MTEEIWNHLANMGEVIYVKRGEVIYQRIRKQVKCYVYLLEKGICALSSTLEAGDTRVYLYFHDRRIIGFNHLLARKKPDGGHMPEFYIVAKTPCVLYAMEEQRFFRMMQTDHKVNEYLMNLLADNYWEVLVHMHRMYEDSAVSRLCRLLYTVSEAAFQGEVGILPRFFTYEELAQYLGSHTVTVSRIMAQLKKKGVIDRGKKGVEIKDKRYLVRMMEGKEPLDY